MSEATTGWATGLTYKATCERCKVTYDLAARPPAVWTCRACVVSHAKAAGDETKRRKARKAVAAKVLSKRHARHAGKPVRLSLAKVFSKLGRTEILGLLDAELSRTSREAGVVAFLVNALADRCGWTQGNGIDPLVFCTADLGHRVKLVRKVLGSLKRPAGLVPFRPRLSKREGWIPAERKLDVGHKVGHVASLPAFWIGKGGEKPEATDSTIREFHCPDCGKTLKDIPHPNLPTSVRAKALAFVKGHNANNSDGFCTRLVESQPCEKANEIMASLVASVSPKVPETVKVKLDVETFGESRVPAIRIRTTVVRVLPNQSPVDFAIYRLSGKGVDRLNRLRGKGLPVALTAACLPPKR